MSSKRQRNTKQTKTLLGRVRTSSWDGGVSVLFSPTSDIGLLDSFLQYSSGVTAGMPINHQIEVWCLKGSLRCITNLQKRDNYFQFKGQLTVVLSELLHAKYPFPRHVFKSHENSTRGKQKMLLLKREREREKKPLFHVYCSAPTKNTPHLFESMQTEVHHCFDTKSHKASIYPPSHRQKRQKTTAVSQVYSGMMLS